MAHRCLHCPCLVQATPPPPKSPGSPGALVGSGRAVSCRVRLGQTRAGQARSGWLATVQLKNCESCWPIRPQVFIQRWRRRGLPISDICCDEWPRQYVTLLGRGNLDHGWSDVKIWRLPRKPAEWSIHDNQIYNYPVLLRRLSHRILRILFWHDRVDSSNQT